MATAAQIEANRRNSQLSTGPRTAAGKAVIAQNAVRHNLCAALPLMKHESPGEAADLLFAFLQENQPVGINEEVLVYKMAEHFHSLKRAGALLVEEFEACVRGKSNPQDLALMLRYHTSADRGFGRALAELLKLQKQRRLQEIGFVRQKSQAAQSPELPQTPALESAAQSTLLPLPAGR